MPEPLRERGIALRLQGPEDMAAQLALFIEARLPEFAALPWPDAAKHAFLADQSRLQQHHYATHYPDAELYTVLEDGSPVGRLYVDRGGPDEIRLVDIIFFESRRGRGFGSAFIGRLMDLARADGRKVGLHVEPHNPARGLYQRLGFVDVEERGAYIYMIWTPGVGEPREG